jgi:hypothetical protein
VGVHIHYQLQSELTSAMGQQMRKSDLYNLLATEWVVYGKPATEALSDEVERLNAKRVFGDVLGVPASASLRRAIEIIPTGRSIV